jgi:hypothetical protein
MHFIDRPGKRELGLLAIASLLAACPGGHRRGAPDLADEPDASPVAQPDAANARTPDAEPSPHVRQDRGFAGPNSATPKPDGGGPRTRDAGQEDPRRRHLRRWIHRTVYDHLWDDGHANLLGRNVQRL